MGDVSPLGQLIEDVRAAFLDRYGVHLSYEAIARRGGGAVSRKRIQQIATGPIKTLPPESTLRALARGLEVPYRIVLEKALEAAGYTPPPLDARQDESDRRIG